ncbi:DUF4834 family protein [Patiriisocius marinus]|nr:DUF4834 family protein [Patiriisocius marinus]
MAFIKTILIILLIYFGLKFLLKLASPYIMRYIQKKAGQKFEDMFSHMQGAQPQQKKEGEITIDKIPKQKSGSKPVGEYVDFEEID